jgi:hypothetical protein
MVSSQYQQQLDDTAFTVWSSSKLELLVMGVSAKFTADCI